MHKLSITLLLVAAAACGDNKATQNPPDAFVFHGADAANPDAPGIDASPDASQAAGSKVWAVRDWNVNGTQIAGRFLSTDTLPFGNGTLPATVAPGGTSVLASG